MHKTTIGDVRLFILKSNAYLKEFPKKTKVEYALTKLSKKYQLLMTEFNEAVEDYEQELSDARATHASTDKDGVMLTNQDGTFRYSPEGFKLLTRELRTITKRWETLAEELLSKYVEVETHIISDEDIKAAKLSDTYYESFKGFIF